MKNAVGFYWTLPVPWAGFTELPKDIDASAEASRTIRYQRDLIRRHAKDRGYRLVKEQVFLEIDPDRGSRQVLEALRPLEVFCREEEARLLFADFSEVQGWRSHGPLTDWADRSRVEVEPVFPDEILIDGQPFDPHAHFSDWRARQRDWTDGKAERRARALSAAGKLRAEGFTYGSIASKLTAEGLLSPTGRPWTGDGIRKLLIPLPSQDGLSHP